jgi:hypothetical protein
MVDAERGSIVRCVLEEHTTGRFNKQILAQATDWGLRTRRGSPLGSQALGVLPCNQLYAGSADVPE